MSAPSTFDPRETAILTRAIQPANAKLSPTAARALLRIQLDPQDRQRLHELLVKNQEDRLTSAERSELDSHHGHFAVIDNPPSNAAKGKSFENLACYLLSGIPGIKIIARNEMNTFATEEIDIACMNENDPAGLSSFADFFLVECKGWSKAVTSEQVSWFLTKIRHRGVRFGIPIAANGITGESEHLSRANFLVGVEMATFGIKMVIVTREEIEKLTSGEELAKLIHLKVCNLIASGGRCY